MKLFNGNKFLETKCWEIFLNYMLGNFWDSYDGNLLMETVLGNSGGCERFFDGGSYGTMLQHHTTVLMQWYLECKLSIPAAQTFLERSKQSYRKCRAGGWGCSTNVGK